MSETDWQARYLDKLERDVAELKAEFRAAEARIGARIDQFLGEVRHLDEQRRADIREAVQEMRRLDEQRRADLRETVQEMRRLDEQRQADMREIKQEMKELQRSIVGANRWLIGQVIAVVVSVAGLVGTAVWAIFQVLRLP